MATPHTKQAARIDVALDMRSSFVVGPLAALALPRCIQGYRPPVKTPWRIGGDSVTAVEHGDPSIQYPLPASTRPRNGFPARNRARFSRKKSMTSSGTFRPA